MANGQTPAPAADVPHFDTRFLVQTPDGSTTTQVLRTDRPLSTPELAAHVADQGATFVGYADTPPAPAPAAAPAAAAPDQTLTQRARGVFLPERSFTSQLPSIAGATVLGSVGGAVGAMTGPLAPVAIPALASAGAAVGGGLGEAGDLVYEHLTGATPAEPGTGWQRITNAAARSGATELVAGPLAYAVRPITKAIMPVAKAAADLAPVLAQDLPAGVQAVESATPGMARSINQLLNPDTASAVLAKANLTPEGQQTLFRAWWQRQAGKAPEEIASSWESLAGKAQQTLAGPHVDQMQTVVNTLKTGQDVPILRTIGDVATGGVPAGIGYVSGHPGLTAAGTLYSAVKGVGEAAPYVASRLVRTPEGASFLGSLPKVAQVVAPRFTLPRIGEVPVPLARAGAQSVVAMPGVWPATSTLAD